jgi:hypothetical protein
MGEEAMTVDPEHEHWHYRPGEMVIATELPPNDDAASATAHQVVRGSIEQQLAGSVGGVFKAEQSRPEPLVFRAPGRPPLAFLFYDLDDNATPREFVKQVVSETHANRQAALAQAQTRGLTPVGAMPHWFGSAQQDYSDGSPASYPRGVEAPAREGRWRYTYESVAAGLNLSSELQHVRDDGHVPVLILDTEPDWARARHQAAQFADHNAQLEELVNLLGGGTLPDWHMQALAAYNQDALPLTKGPGGGRGDQDIRDHALFVAGLIHELEPKSTLHMRPVLNRFGVGDLHLLLHVLQDVLRDKPEGDPLVVNMSLGFAPKIEHLPWLWYDVPKPQDPGFVRDVPIRNQTHSVATLRRSASDVEETMRLLHGGLDRLSEYLLLNNCLAVAAAGNDSLQRVEHGEPRLGPRIPARYHSVLGVAATQSEPTNAATYSNIGDEAAFGDHVATFGGEVRTDGQPQDGVIGLYSAPFFPPVAGQNQSQLPNTSGWAMWSGTSFATAIAAGLVAGFWGVRRSQTPGTSAEDVLESFNDLADHYAPALRTPSIGMRGEWRPVSSE